MLASIKNLMPFLFTVIIGLAASIAIWFFVAMVNTTKVAVQHPSPMAKQLDSYKGSQVQKCSQRAKNPICWQPIKLIGKSWFIEGSPISVDQFNSAELILLMINGQGPTAARKLALFIIEHQLQKKVFVITRSDGFIKDIRYHSNEIALNYGQAFMTRLSSLIQLYLDHSPKFDKDIAWVNEKLLRKNVIPLYKLFNRKSIPFFIGPDLAKDDQLGLKDLPDAIWLVK